MENEKRPIDAIALIRKARRMETTDNNGIPVDTFAVPVLAIEDAPTVDAVPIEQHNELFERYYELRENFIDYVCCGVTNPAPFCKNRCAECVNNYGWCKSNDKCRGFNPDGERKTK